MSDDARRGIAAASYAVLGAVLLWSRLTGLDKGGYCCDEIMTVSEYVGEGPGAILTGAYAPNNHQLFSLLGWATTSVVGESETVLRLGAALPFIAGVLVVTIWLHRRLGALSGLLFLFFATFSPLLLDLSRLARGYGLAFLAMSVLVVAALEAERSGRGRDVVAFCAAGVVGALTLPHFAVTFLAVGVVLLARPALRSRVGTGLAVSIVAVVVWYLPHADDILRSSRQDYGLAISSSWLVTAPLDQTLVPAISLIDDAFVRPDFESLVVVLALVVLIAPSPLLREWPSALILCSGVVTTVVVFWWAETHVVPRFFSFLLVPLLLLLATGISSILAQLRRPKLGLHTALALALLTVVALSSAPYLATIPREPREALREAGAAIRQMAPATTPVFGYVPHPNDLVFHLGRPVVRPRTPAAAQRVCDKPGAAILVMQQWTIEPAVVPCTTRAGVRHYRFEQYARGEAIDVWLIPPARATAER